MKKLKTLIGVVGGIAVLGVGVLTLGSQAFADNNERYWGPQDRETLTWPKSADHVVFNSFTNNPTVGDERNFVRICEYDGTHTNDCTNDEMSVEAGKQYEVTVYYHNNASATLNDDAHGNIGYAYNTQIGVDVPTTLLHSGNKMFVTGTINYDYYANKSAAESKQLTHGSVWDTVGLINKTKTALEIDYLEGSAKIMGRSDNNIYAYKEHALSPKALFNTDGKHKNGVSVSLDYNNTDITGILPGCNEYASYITFVIAVNKTNYEVWKTVSVAGANDWRDTLTARPGDALDFKVTYKNTGTSVEKNVTVHDILPEGMSFVAGTARAVTPKTEAAGMKDGVAVTGSLLFEDNGMGIGDFEGGQTGTVTYQVKLADAEAFACGDTKLYNKAAVTINEYSNSLSQATAVTVHNECGPSEIPNTGPGEIILASVVVIAIGGGVVYYVHTRRVLRKTMAGVGEQKDDTPKQN